MNQQYEEEPYSGQFNQQDEAMIWDFNDYIQPIGEQEFLQNQTLPQKILQNATQYTAAQYKTLQLKSKQQPTNNIPTVMGKNFKKYLKYLKKQQNVQIPEKLNIFISKQKKKAANEKTKSVSFALADFNQFLQCEKSTQFFQFFLKHYAFNYFSQSNKISNPLFLIQNIEYYLASTYQAVPYINQNRQSNKNAKKQEKEQLNVEIQIQNQNNIHLQQQQEDFQPINLQNNIDQINVDSNPQIQCSLQQLPSFQLSEYSNDRQFLDR